MPCTAGGVYVPGRLAGAAIGSGAAGFLAAGAGFFASAFVGAGFAAGFFAAGFLAALAAAFFFIFMGRTLQQRPSDGQGVGCPRALSGSRGAPARRRKRRWGVIGSSEISR